MGYVMDIDVIDSQERGVTQNDWLYSLHTYSFGKYQDIKRLNFGTLRVFNDDTVEPGKGFGTHAHDNMEIVTIVLEGALEHTDSTGNRGVIKAGDVQRMTAGSGIEHSEYNASKEEKVHFLQIWIYPERRNLEPGYQQMTFSDEAFKNTLTPIVSKAPTDKSLSIHQDATFYMGHFDKGKAIKHPLRSKKHGDYLFVIEGEVKLGDTTLKKGDSAHITEADSIEMKALETAKLLLIEVSVNAL